MDTNQSPMEKTKKFIVDNKKNILIVIFVLIALIIIIVILIILFSGPDYGDAEPVKFSKSNDGSRVITASNFVKVPDNEYYLMYNGDIAKKEYDKAINLYIANSCVIGGYNVSVFSEWGIPENKTGIDVLPEQKSLQLIGRLTGKQNELTSLSLLNNQNLLYKGQKFYIVITDNKNVIIARKQFVVPDKSFKNKEEYIYLSIGGTNGCTSITNEKL